MNNLCILMMAAGKGTRMVSNRAKVLHAICGVPMLRLIYRAAASLEPEDIFVVIGQDAERVRGIAGWLFRCSLSSSRNSSARDMRS